VNTLEYNKTQQGNVKNKLSWKSKIKRRSVDKSWHGLVQNNRPKSPIDNPTTYEIRLAKRRIIQQHMCSNELLSRKITEMYMITTKMEFLTYTEVLRYQRTHTGSVYRAHMANNDKTAWIHYWIMFIVKYIICHSLIYSK